MEKEFIITGMKCQGCVTTVHDALAAVPGVQSVSVNLEAQEATIQGTFDTTAILNSVPAVAENVTRVKQIESTKIVSVDGNLSWP